MNNETYVWPLLLRPLAPLSQFEGPYTKKSSIVFESLFEDPTTIA
eukprot:CAMPEP_0177763488 /NCGR_PEP_ID=MMETSP0491_2-20121128/6900_1 /TAXON_ID=63592 /ORGANISM="Tetraselmis chuii, Strain PLY429" /LENGTH=44 /DNA_ID= /DNA_START= /DNA_END= /DNA_ORIENTATION=